MVVKSLKIKTKSNYYYDDMIYLDDFDVKLVKVGKRESRIGVDIILSTCLNLRLILTA